MLPWMLSKERMSAETLSTSTLQKQKVKREHREVEFEEVEEVVVVEAEDKKWKEEDFLFTTFQRKLLKAIFITRSANTEQLQMLLILAEDLLLLLTPQLKRPIKLWRTWKVERFVEG